MIGIVRTKLTSPTKEEHTSTRRRIAQAIGMLALMAIGCDVTFLLPSGPAFPTAAPGVMETIIAGTAGAAQTQTAALRPPPSTPTFTATVTRTPTLEPSFTPTFIFSLRSATPRRTATSTLGSGSGKLACALIDQDPNDGAVFKPNAKFDAVWEVQNTGAAGWNSGNVDFVFATGRKMQDQDVYDLPRDVPSGDTVRLVVDMTAPKVSGSYKTVWTLEKGGNDFCRLTLEIVVK